MSTNNTYRNHLFYKILVVITCFISQVSMAQRISFSTWTGSDEITITISAGDAKTGLQPKTKHHNQE